MDNRTGKALDYLDDLQGTIEEINHGVVEICKRLGELKDCEAKYQLLIWVFLLDKYVDECFHRIGKVGDLLEEALKAKDN